MAGRMVPQNVLTKCPPAVGTEDYTHHLINVRSPCRPPAHLTASLVPRRRLPAGRNPRGRLPPLGDGALDQRRLERERGGGPGGGLLAP